MATNEHKPIAAGSERAYFGLLDSNGVFIGNGTTAPAAGAQTGSALARIDGFKSADTSVPELERVQATGDDSALTEFQFESTALAGGNLEVAVHDMDFAAKVLGLSVIDNGNLSHAALGQPKNPDRKDVVLVLQRIAKSYTAGSRGTSRYEGIIVPKGTVTPLLSSFAERAVGNPRYQITMSKSDAYPWGATLSTGTEGTEEAAFIEFATPNPLMIERWTGDGAETVFNLTETAAAADADNVLVWVDGLPQTYTTHYTTTTSAITFGTAPQNNAPVIAVYLFTTS
jgi:hypothetical protein